jgi:hypothetical protein
MGKYRTINYEAAQRHVKNATEGEQQMIEG